jgi:hypothetical protein
VKLTCSEQTTGQFRASTRRICGTNGGRTRPSAFCILHGIHPSSNAKAGIVSGGRWLEQAPPLSQLRAFRRAILSRLPFYSTAQLLPTQHNHILTRQDTRTVGRILSNNPTRHAKLYKTRHAWRKGYGYIMSTSRVPTQDLVFC